ncbi:MAG: HAD-superfamily hydrolase, subfamily variant 1 [Marmoricola sp.]|nr:HAD-superfamily hydrolase, subfamily variant 1 [Marmoricola sp.]
MASSPNVIRTVVFDVGEVLIDESTEYGTWADWLGVPRHTFSAVFGAVIARGEDYRNVFEHFRPGFDLAAERQKRLDAGQGEFFNGRDLYPDVRPAFDELKDAGYSIGIAGNQTARAGVLLGELNLPADFILTSDDLGAEKPDVAFFENLIESRDLEPATAAYVGDRVENDIVPATKAGFRTVLVRRGPWGYINDSAVTRGQASACVSSLREIRTELARLE